MKQIERLREGAAELASSLEAMRPADGDHGHEGFAFSPEAPANIAGFIRALLSHIDALEARVGDQVKQHISLHNLAEEYLSRAEAAERALAESVEVLKPFADCCEYIGDDESDEEWAKFRLLISDYRQARAFLTKRGEK